MWLFRKSPSLERITDLEAKVLFLNKELAYIKGNNSFLRKQQQECGGRAQFWEGKFHAVKRENNKLRNKLFKKQVIVTTTEASRSETNTSDIAGS